MASSSPSRGGPLTTQPDTLAEARESTAAAVWLVLGYPRAAHCAIQSRMAPEAQSAWPLRT
jgi:hypothetical protein